MDLEAQVAALQEHHSRGKISDANMELMIKGARSKWARHHPPCPEAEIESASPRAEGENVNIDGNEGARVTCGEMRGAVRVHTASVGGTQNTAMLEQRLTNLEMGEHESATAYCNHAQSILADLHMAGVDCSMSSYVTHVIKVLPASYNLLRRMVKLPGVWEELDEDMLSSYIIEEEFTLESERRKEQLLPQFNYGRAVDFEVWLDDLQLFLQCNSKEGLSLFDLTLVARYSSPATAALSRLMLPYLFPHLAAFATVADLVAHLRTSDARYRAALPTAFLPTNSPPMYITLYYLVTRLPDSLSSVRDHFLSLCPTELTVDMLEERLAAAEKSILAVGASRGDRRTPFFKGCSLVPLLPSIASTAAVDLVGTEEVGAVSAPSGRRRTGKGKGSKGGGGGGGGSGGGGGGGGGGGPGGGGVGGGGGGGGGSGGGSGGGGAGRGAATQLGGLGGGQRQQQLRSRETLSVQQLREWYAGRGRSGGAGPCAYVIRTSTHSGKVCGLPHTTQRCFGRLTDAWRTQFPDAVDLPRWHDLLLQNVPIFDLDFDAILAAMYAHADIIEGDYYLRVPPDPGTVAAALVASASAALGASAAAAPSADSTTLTPLSRPIAVSLADPSRGPVLAHSSTVLPCPAAPSGFLSGLHLPSFSTNLVSGADLQDAWVDQFTPGGQRVTHCTCSRTGRHLATFTRRPGSSLYIMTTAPPPIPASGQVAATSQVFAAASRSSPASAPCSCRPLAHETLLWHHRLGHPSLPRLRGMASRALVSGLPRSLPPLPPGPAPTCVPCVEGRQRAAPHSSSFPPTEAPLQTLHMDVWGPARVRGQGHEHLAEPVEVAVASGAARGAETGGAETGGAEFGGTTPARAASRGALGVPSRREPLSPQRLREWYSRRGRVAAGAGAAGGVGGATGATGGAGGAGGGAGAGAAGGAPGVGAAGAGFAGGATGAGAAGGTGGTTGATGGAGAAGGGAGAGAAGGAPGAGAGGGATRPRPYYVPLLQQVLGSPPSPGPPPPFPSPPPVQSQSQLQPASLLPGPSPYCGPSRGFTERREPESRPVSPASRSASPARPVCTGRVSRPRLPPVPGTHSMTLSPSTAPQRFPLPSPPACSLHDGPDTESYSLRAASPTVTRFLATAVTDPLFESSAASALVAELVDFASACRLDYVASLVAQSASASVCPPSVKGECALGTDVFEDRQEDLECFAAASPHLVSMLLAPEGDPDALDIPTPRSYAEAIEDEVPPPGVNIVSGMWIFRVKRPPGSPPAFKARYVARGFSQRQGVDFIQTFSPTPKMTTLRLLLHVAAQRDYELHSLDFSTAFLQGSLHEEIWLRRPPGFTGSFPTGTQWSLRRPVYSLCQAPREWHDTLKTTLAALGFAPSTADPSLFLRTDATLPPFYVLVYVDDLVFPTAETEALAHVKSFSASASRTPRHSPLLCLPVTRSELHLRTSPTSGMGLMLGGRARVVLTGHADASWVDDLATQRSSQGYTFSLGSGSSSVLSSSCEAEIYAGAMAAQELRWLTYLLTDLGEAPRSPPDLYVDNKAMLALCQEHRLEHRTKHIALRYFLARELQQRGQLRLAYVASQANTDDVFTKALQPCDHQRFCNVLGLVPTVPHLLTS
ncbi:unnamed protein product [Closterium sp. NIES-53]